MSNIKNDYMLTQCYFIRCGFTSRKYTLRRWLLMIESSSPMMTFPSILRLSQRCKMAHTAFPCSPILQVISLSYVSPWISPCYISWIEVLDSTFAAHLLPFHPHSLHFDSLDSSKSPQSCSLRVCFYFWPLSLSGSCASGMWPSFRDEVAPW